MGNESDHRELVRGMIWLGWVVGGATIIAIAALAARAAF